MAKRPSPAMIVAMVALMFRARRHGGRGGPGRARSPSRRSRRSRRSRSTRRRRACRSRRRSTPTRRPTRPTRRTPPTRRRAETAKTATDGRLRDVQRQRDASPTRPGEEPDERERRQGQRTRASTASRASRSRRRTRRSAGINGAEPDGVRHLGDGANVPPGIQSLELLERRHCPRDHDRRRDPRNPRGLGIPDLVPELIGTTTRHGKRGGFGRPASFHRVPPRNRDRGR